MTRPSLTATVGRNVASYFVARAIEAVLLLVALPLVVSGLGPERYGLFSIGLIAVLYLGIVEAGLAQAQVTLLSEKRARDDARGVEGLLGSALAIYAAAAFAGGLGVVLLGPPLAERLFRIPEGMAAEAGQVLRLVGAYLFFMLLQAPLRAALVSRHQVAVVNGALLAGAALKYPAMIAVLKLGGGLVPAFAAYAAGMVVEAGVVAAAAARLLRSSGLRPRWDAGRAGELLRFGAATSASTVTGALLYHVDKIVISLYLPVAVVGVYHVAYSLAARIAEIPRAVVGAVPPALAELAGAGQTERLTRAYRRTFKLLFAAPLHLAALLVLGGDVLLEAWVGPALARDGAGVLRLLATAYLASCLAHGPYMLANATGCPGVPARTRGLLLIPGAAAAVVLTRQHGIEGAALSVLILAVADFLFMAAWVHRRSRVAFPLEPLWKPLVLSAVLGAATNAVMPRTGGLAAVLAVMGASYALYLAALFAWAADPEERALLPWPRRRPE